MRGLCFTLSIKVCRPGMMVRELSLEKLIIEAWIRKFPWGRSLSSTKLRVFAVLLASAWWAWPTRNYSIVSIFCSGRGVPGHHWRHHLSHVPTGEEQGECGGGEEERSKIKDQTKTSVFYTTEGLTYSDTEYQRLTPEDQRSIVNFSVTSSPSGARGWCGWSQASSWVSVHCISWLLRFATFSLSILTLIFMMVIIQVLMIILCSTNALLISGEY